MAAGGRAPRAGLVAREAGKEVINNYQPLLIRLIPGSSASRYFTRFLGQISNYLGRQPIWNRDTRLPESFDHKIPASLMRCCHYVTQDRVPVIRL